MIGIDLGNHQRHVRLHAERGRVAHHRASGGGESGLQLTRNGGVQRGKNHPRGTLGLGRRNRYFSDLLGDGDLQPPAHRLAVRLPGGTVRGSQPRHLKPWMVLQQLNDPLSNYTGSTQNSDWDSWLWHVCKKSVYITAPDCPRLPSQAQQRSTQFSDTAAIETLWQFPARPRQCPSPLWQWLPMPFDSWEGAARTSGEMPRGLSPAASPSPHGDRPPLHIAAACLPSVPPGKPSGRDAPESPPHFAPERRRLRRELRPWDWCSVSGSHAGLDARFRGIRIR